MKERLKIFIGWIMLALLCYNMYGYFLVFELSEALNRSSMNEFLSGADDDELQVLKITDVSKIIREENHEIIFEGKRYDVKKEILKDGIIYFYCIHDHAEENLYAGFYSSLRDNSGAQTEKPGHYVFDLFKHLVKNYYSNEAVAKIPDAILVNSVFVRNDTFQYHFFSSVITPPPKGILS